MEKVFHCLRLSVVSETLFVHLSGLIEFYRVLREKKLKNFIDMVRRFYLTLNSKLSLNCNSQNTQSDLIYQTPPKVITSTSQQSFK